MLQTVFFYILSLGAIVSGAGVVLSRSAVYSVLWLVAAMGCTAGLFALLGAFFVAAIQILVYAGAILVLFLFIVMLLDAEEMKHAGTFKFGAAPVFAAVISGAFLLQAWRVIRLVTPGAAQTMQGTPKAIGQVLFKSYVVPFELTSFLLLAAVVSIVVLAKKEPA